MRTRPGPDEGRQWTLFVAAAVIVCVLTEILREYRLGPSYGVFVDEITYLRLGISMATNGSVELYGEPFFLHPPLFFVLESVALRLTHLPSDIIEAVYRFRQLNVAFAGITAAGLFTLVARMTRQWLPALLIATLYAVDPFTIRMTSRILLEPAAGMWIVGGYLVLVSTLMTPPVAGGSTNGQRPPVRRRLRSNAGWIGAGVLFGFAILTKEPVALFSVVPVVLAAVLRWIPYKSAAITVATATATYAPYPIVVAATGHWSQFVNEKASGLLRLSGALQEYGFNREGSASFFVRILERMDTLAGTYAILAVGAIGCLYLLRSQRVADRLVALWAAAAYAYGAFAMARGTLEEQFFYYIMLPALVVVSVAIHRFARAHTDPRREGRHVALPIATAVLLYLVFAGATWYEVRTVPDDSYVRLVRYLDQHAPEGSAIAVGAASEVTEFVLDQNFAPFRYSSVTEVVENDIRYVVVTTKSLVDGDVASDERLFEHLDQHGRVRFTSKGRSVGTLILYELPAPTASAEHSSVLPSR